MPTQSIPIGPQTTLVANVIYALPSVSCDIFNDTAIAMQVSQTLTFVDNVPLVFTNGVAPGAGRFIRATTAGGSITLRKRS